MQDQLTQQERSLKQSLLKQQGALHKKDTTHATDAELIQLTTPEALEVLKTAKRFNTKAQSRQSKLTAAANAKYAEVQKQLEAKAAKLDAEYEAMTQKASWYDQIKAALNLPTKHERKKALAPHSVQSSSDYDDLAEAYLDLRANAKQEIAKANNNLKLGKSLINQELKQLKKAQ